MDLRKVLITLFIVSSIVDALPSKDTLARRRRTKKPGKKKPTKSTCVCGKKASSNTKIVGGRLAGPHPWIGALVFTGKAEPYQFCGSTLINDRYMLTASHCVNEIKSTQNYEIYLGSNVINGSDAIKYKISQILKHSRFNSKTLDYDIALIKLQTPVVMSNRVRPICLPKGGTNFAGRQSNVAGWGTLAKGGTPVNRLRETWVKVLTNADCAKSYSEAGVTVTQNMLCAAAKGKDSCSGDSGGPLVLKDGNSFSQVGVVSYGIDCGSAKYPGVYTRVTRFLRWIRDNTKDAGYCS